MGGKEGGGGLDDKVGVGWLYRFCDGIYIRFSHLVILFVIYFLVFL